MSNFNLENRLEQKQLLIPSLLLEMKLLQMNVLELDTYLKEISEENPFVDYEENMDALSNYLQNQSISTISANEVLDKVFSSNETPYEFFKNQLNYIDASSQEISTALNLIPYLNDYGGLSKNLKEISVELSIPYFMLENAKVILESIEEDGWGYESFKELALIQIWLSDKVDSDKLFDFLFENFDNFTQKKLIFFFKHGYKISDIEYYIKLFTDIVFLPSIDSGIKEKYIIPDAVVFVKDGRVHYNCIEPYKVYLYTKNNPENKETENNPENNSSNIVELPLEDEISKNLKSDSQLKKYYNDAKNLKFALQSRKDAFNIFMKHFVILQQEFFFKGPAFIHPISQKDFASKIGISESTVSRIINEKYIDTPFGIFSLKHFFSATYNKKEGLKAKSKTQSRTVIIDEINNIIKNESRDKPYTDEAIVELLEKKGYNISRRTVAKYRELSGILPANLRKELKK